MAVRNCSYIVGSKIADDPLLPRQPRALISLHNHMSDCWRGSHSRAALCGPPPPRAAPPPGTRQSSSLSATLTRITSSTVNADRGNTEKRIRVGV